MNQQPFSRRHGFASPDKDISIHDDAPSEVRDAILKIAEGEIHLGPSTIRSILCTVLRRMPDASNWSEYPNVWYECQSLINDAPWYKVYDFVEAVYRHLADGQQRHSASEWETLINEYFAEVGVGWRMTRGELVNRGTEAFETAVDGARAALDEAGLLTAKQEIHEALRDLSRRPHADLTGAVQHAMAALECTAREAGIDSKATLGQILKQNSKLVPKPLDEAVSKMWGWASGTARHVKEGTVPSRAEAELAVHIAGAVCSYLGKVLAASEK